MCGGKVEEMVWGWWNKVGVLLEGALIWINFVNFQTRRTLATKKFKSKITKNENQLIKQASKEEENHVEKINETTQKSNEEDLDSEAEIHMYVFNYFTQFSSKVIFIVKPNSDSNLIARRER